MQIQKPLLMVVLGLPLGLFGCGGDDSVGDDASETGDGDGDPSGDGDGDPSGDGDGDPSGDGDGDPSGDGDGDPSGDGDGDPSGDGDGDPQPDPFVFADAEPDTYTRVDRMGFPAVATALITSKDAYNAANPTDDANADFVGEITASLQGLHNALDGDLIGLTLTPCSVADCLLAGAPLIVPDTLTLDLDSNASFPNGRKLEDPVMDVTLAVLLLDLVTHSATTFADIPLNPAANDVAFLAEFPYLAPPHD